MSDSTTFWIIVIWGLVSFAAGLVLGARWAYKRVVVMLDGTLDALKGIK